MKKLLLIAALALSLGGCGAGSTLPAIVGATVTQSQVDVARSSYDGGFLAGLRRYALLPRCAAGQTFLKNQCHDPKTLKTMRQYDKAIEADFNSVQANLNAGNNNALVNSWSILQNAISSANLLKTQTGI